MATMSDIVRRAYRKIGVVAADEPMSADQADDGLDQLNDMMHGWKVFGIDIAHATLALGDTFPMDDEFVEGAIYQLAQRLAPDSGVQGPNADAFFRALQAAYLVVPTQTIPLTLRRTASQRRFYSE